MDCARPACRPPTTALTTRRLVLVWVVVVGLLGALLIVARHTGSGLDDPDPARERPGFLDAFGSPSAAPQVTSLVPGADRRAVIFFVRPRFVAPLCRAIARDGSLRQRADLAIASSGPGDSCPGLPVVADVDGRLAGAFGMRRPRDRGPPVGYAVVDRNGRIRYRTLDPDVVSGLREVETMAKAAP
jgi:hypothetical protein